MRNYDDIVEKIGGVPDNMGAALRETPGFDNSYEIESEDSSYSSNAEYNEGIDEEVLARGVAEGLFPGSSGDKWEGTLE